MADLQLILLNDDDLECVGKIVKNVKGVSTPEAAIKWALKQCSRELKETYPFVIEWEEPAPKLVVKPPKSGGGPSKIKIPLWDHKLGIYKLPLDILTDLGHSVVVGSHTLQGLAANPASLSMLLSDAKIGKVK